MIKFKSLEVSECRLKTLVLFGDCNGSLVPSSPSHWLFLLQALKVVMED